MCFGDAVKKVTPETGKAKAKEKTPETKKFLDPEERAKRNPRHKGFADEL